MNLASWERHIVATILLALSIAALAWSVELVVVMYIAIGYWIAHG